ncbi:MAG TPA: LytTR family DNA-binding domain-containing protein [Puia sp.]|uniref:LytR/AlgR family response regulator transcription factor n=1 Tax=Puia sp. TaxID=2045100 RepID=UPI002C509A81|nr:LytTR family DNA-binding domain-containing protein [Puia sp.]HVU94751.1 LytTR family DNA-binding domain-containing protein [Puia sp.]
MLKDLHYMIVDDEPLAIDVIENYLQRLETAHITRCGNAVEAFQLLQKKVIDCIFLDIEMPLLSGLDLLKSLKEPPAIIITTAYRDYAVEGFELEVTDYLVKPISFPRFMKALEKIAKTSRPQKEEEPPVSGKDHLFLKVDKKFIKVLITDILFIESLKDYVRVHTRDGAYITYQSLTEITDKLPTGNFARVHRSYTIALDKINGIDGNCVDIAGKLIPVSRENRPDVFRKLRK